MARKFAVFFCLAFLCACKSPVAVEPPAGVAAVVDGRPIGLRQLEYYYDLVLLGSMADNAALSRLASGYGSSLAVLIVEELAQRDLEKVGHPVSDAEVEAAMAAMRRDYTDEAFAKMLAEEAIDPELLRGRLRGRLAMEKLAASVLRPTVSIAAEEAQEYYRANAAAFGRPAKVKLAVARGATKDEARKIMDSLRKNGQAATPEVKEITYVEDRLSSEWREALKKLKPGEATPPLADKPGYVVLALVERWPAKAADPVASYPRVEAALLDVKMRAAFAAWLENALAKAVITVNPGVSLAAVREPSDAVAAPEQESAREAEPSGQAAGDAAALRSDEDKSSEELAREAGK
jgi:hypothetical protein